MTEDSDRQTDERVVLTDDDHSGRGADPSVVDTLVVHESDLIAAVEARDRNRRQTVLRVTPPFAARMRARLHVSSDAAEPNASASSDERAGESGEDQSDRTESEPPEQETPTPVTIPPRAMIDDVPRFPGRGASEWRSRVAQAVCDRLDGELSELDSPRILTLGE